MKKILMLIILWVPLSTSLMSYRINADCLIPAPEKPNVILVLMDDMGYGDLECYGGFPYHTPSINKLANEGMRFTNFYVSQAVCSASRSSFLTGCSVSYTHLRAHETGRNIVCRLLL